MPVIRSAGTRRTETPNAVMTTLASPTLGGAELAMWRVDMRPGAAGPLHTFDVGQVWTVVRGGATIELGGEHLVVTAGDTAVMPAAVARRVSADAEQGFGAIVAAAPAAYASAPDGTGRRVPGWTV